MKVNQAERMDSVREYYFSRKLKEIARMQADGKKIINLGVGSPDLLPPPKVIDKLIQSAKTSTANKYQPYIGIEKLRKQISSWYEKIYKVRLDPSSEILPLIGSKEGILHLSMTFLQKGDYVLVPNPGYPSYSAAAKLAGAKILNYNLNEKNNWWPNFDQLKEQDLKDVKIMWVNYPHMPSGSAPSKKLFEDLIEFAKEHNILICHDNPYSFILNENPMSILSVPDAKDYAIELNSLSKSHHMAGWRMGMMVGHQNFIQAALKFKSNMDSGMFLPIQEAAIEALKTDISWHRSQNQIYQKRKVIAESILKSVGCQLSSKQVGMFVWGKIINGNQNAYELSDKLLERTGVFITPGGIFGSEGESYMRVSLCSTEDQLQEALSVLTKQEI